MLQNGTRPQIVKIFEGGHRACLQVEQTLIQSYGRIFERGSLTNVTPGGEGHVGHSPSAKSQEQLAEYNKSREVPTRAIDPKSGEIVHRFSKHAEAMAAGFSQRGISNALHGWCKTHKDLRWEQDHDE